MIDFFRRSFGYKSIKKLPRYLGHTSTSVQRALRSPAKPCEEGQSPRHSCPSEAFTRDMYLNLLKEIRSLHSEIRILGVRINKINKFNRSNSVRRALRSPAKTETQVSKPDCSNN